MNNEIIYTHRTRSGAKARIICENAAGDFPVIALVLRESDQVEIPVTLTKELREYVDGTTSWDLFEYNPWQDLAVDTPVLVCQTIDHNTWVRRHFAKFEAGHVYVWEDGRTSFTTKSVVPYKYAKLATE